MRPIGIRGSPRTRPFISESPPGSRASYTASAAIFEARGHALLVAGGFTLAVGAGKELLDLAGWGDPSWRDFAADVAGTIVGLAIAWSVDLVIRGVGNEHPLFTLPHRPAPAVGASPLVISF